MVSRSRTKGFSVLREYFRCTLRNRNQQFFHVESAKQLIHEPYNLKQLLPVLLSKIEVKYKSFHSS